MFMATIWFYNVDMGILFVILGVELYCFLIYPFIIIKACYLQIDYLPFKTTLNQTAALTIRFLASFLNVPFCLCIGKFLAGTYQLIAYGLMFRKIPKKKIGEKSD